MKKILTLALLASLISGRALADWTGKDATPATITFKNPGVCTSVACVPVAQLYDGTNVVTLTTAGGDAASNAIVGVPVYSRNVLWNGTTWDRWTGDLTSGGWVNVKASVLPTGAATAAKQPALGTAGTPSADVLTVQGVTSMTPLKTDGSATTQPVSAASLPLPTGAATSALQPTNASQGSTTSGQTGPLVQASVLTAAPSYTTAQTSPLNMTTSGGLRVADVAAEASLVTIATNSALPLPAQTGVGNINIGAVTNAGSKYITVAASQTATVLQASTGAIGDYLSHCVIYPASTSPGVVTVFDNANAAATNAIAFPGGASSTSNLVPISVPVGALSTAGAWKVTTGANVSVTCYGKFS